MAIPQLNLGPLDQSGYIHQNTRFAGSDDTRIITQYMLHDCSVAERVNNAAQAIIQLLAANPHLRAVFATEPPDALKHIVRECPYLVINDRVVSLSQNPLAAANVPHEEVTERMQF